MIKSFTVTNYLGDSIKLILGEPEKSGFLIKSVEGLGPPKANINTAELSTNDGSIFNSARLDSRNIVFELIFVETYNNKKEMVESIEDIRLKSYKYFPMKKNLELTIETDNRIVKTIGYVESNEPEIFSEQEGTQISIVCPDPFFYADTTSTDFHSVESTFEFAFSNESLTDPLLNMGDIYLITEGDVVYDGEYEVGMSIYIHAIGSADNITVYNIKTKETMKIDTAKVETITGSGIIANDDIIINTMRGNKSITLLRDGVSYNILNCLDKNTDWFTLSKGDNRFAFTADEGITNLRFRIENKVVYEGV